MKVHNIAYLCKTGIKNACSNKMMSFASIGVLVACLLLMGMAVLLGLNIHTLTEEVGRQNQLTAYFDKNLSDNDLAKIELKINSLENVLGTRIITEEENLQKLCERLGETPETLLKTPTDDNPLFASCIVQIKSSEEFSQTAMQIEKIKGIVKVNGSKETANMLAAIEHSVLYCGIGIVVLLMAVSVLIVSNTIKLTVFARRREIAIMKYVGATDGFIRLPFLIEGVVIGLLAAVLALLILCAGYTWLIGSVGDHIQIIPEQFFYSAVGFCDVASYMFAGFSATGVLVGILGGSLFVRKYLRV